MIYTGYFADFPIAVFAQQFPESLEPQSSSRFLVWPFVNLHAIIRFKAHSIAPF